MRRAIHRHAAHATVTATACATVLLALPGVARAETVADYQQWYLAELGIAQAHRISQGEGVTVAVIDSGVDATHPDLTGRVLPGYGIGRDAAADGRKDAAQHGTMMAGTIAGAGGANDRVLGIAPKAKILPISVGARVDRAGDGEVSQAIRWAVGHGADVINLSLSGESDTTPAETSAIRYALDNDVVVVAGAGNRDKGQTKVGSPANTPGVIAVSGTGQSATPWSGSVTGPEVVLAAPAVKIVGPVPLAYSSGGIALGDGTSGSAAIVSGVTALVRAAFPDLDAANVTHRLLQTADDLGDTGRDDTFGYGMVNPVAALTATIPEVATHPLVTAASEAIAGTPAVPQAAEQPKPSTLPIVLAIAAVVGLLVLAAAVVLARRRTTAAGPAAPYPPQPFPGAPHPPPPWAGHTPGNPPVPPHHPLPDWQQGQRPPGPPPAR